MTYLLYFLYGYAIIGTLIGILLLWGINYMENSEEKDEDWKEILGHIESIEFSVGPTWIFKFILVFMIGWLPLLFMTIYNIRNER